MLAVLMRLQFQLTANANSTEIVVYLMSHRETRLLSDRLYVVDAPAWQCAVHDVIAMEIIVLWLVCIQFTQ